MNTTCGPNPFEPGCVKGLRVFLAASGVAIGALYGIAPRFVVEPVLGLSLRQEQLHIFRAIMGLYAGIGGLLLYAAGDARRYRAGLLLETVFLGRLQRAPAQLRR
ncbi:DUF4345 domain-containing protein [Pseudomonas sp. RIT-PI-AD]|uniref:DUF4345 domain-containing protein n=1 Tax=Pseudomonas sp. RIT-PI-AD TaxID=3035294 RepID=UPI0021D908AE|nr:DUF4345 domain-containing protein [Pseudomonas sp. RIT-PI-AD]